MSITILSISAIAIILIAVAIIVGMTLYLIGLPLTKLTPKNPSVETEAEE